MLVKSPKYRKSLSKNQLHVLGILYKFRFVSTDLLAELLGKNRSTVYERLYVLEKQGYALKVYDKSYKLLGKPASYCLSAKAITLLRKDEKLDDVSLRNMYKNKALFQKPEYIAHCLNILRVYIALKRQYGTDTFTMFSKFELAQYSYFPKPRPDFYLVRRKTVASKPKEYILDIIDEQTPFFVRRKRLKTYMEHDDSGEWEYDGDPYPSLLFVVPNRNIQVKLIKEAEYNYDRYYVNKDDTNTLVTTMEALTKADKDNRKVWRAILQDEDEPERTSL